MTLRFVIEQMESAGASDVPVARTPELEKLRTFLAVFNRTLRELPENKLLKEI